MPEPAERPLVEGVDYYIEARQWVFTAAYHLRRGQCCASGCRHCPYPQLKEQISPTAETLENQNR